MSELDKYKEKLEKAEEKVRILEQMVGTNARELYAADVELEQKNRELEQFVYIASHDLQEPLRAITSFAELLSDDYSQQLDETGQKSIRYITEASDRMSRLIKDLLDYSSIGRKQELVEVDCNNLLEEIKSNLLNAITESGAAINIGELPNVTAYEIELRSLFQNLLSNAIKFRKPDVPPKICIEATSKGKFWQFEISDNGIGIDEKHKSKIFNIFQRLHNRKKYEGTGIGLSHCKKIVELHEGKIWVESQPDEGSTFYFTILKRKQNEGKT
jgi:light-regulated signal transduction histidine kinase (bacteriophytochrome)